MNIGDKFTFKVAKGRGRPFVGEVTRKMGIFTMMRVKDGSEVRVKTSNIKNSYEFKPYNTKARRAA